MPATRALLARLTRRALAISAIAFAASAIAADWAPGSTDWDKLPDVKNRRSAST